MRQPRTPGVQAKLHGTKSPSPARALMFQGLLAVLIMIPFDLDGLIAIFSAAVGAVLGAPRGAPSPLGGLPIGPVV